MTCQRLVFGAVLAALGALAACGGSSSETPPPLEPDPRGFRYSSAQASPPTAASEIDAGAEPAPGALGADDEAKPHVKPGSTWGGASPKP